jgi:peptidoglycan hydrolase-like protein with peptidoglycan-binding domain
MKKIIILSVLAMMFGITNVMAANIPLEVPPADGSDVGNLSIPPADGSDVSNLSSGAGSSNIPPADGSGVNGSATTTSTSTPVVTPVVIVNTPTFSGGGGGSSGSYYNNAGSVLGAQTGSVLGASIDEATTSTTTCELFKTFMKKGNKNNKAEVIKLQKFLNEELGVKLPLTGFFGSQTEKAVKSFQLKNSETILTPWVKNGSMKKINATGYFFKTTQHVANKMVCPNTIVEVPLLK